MKYIDSAVVCTDLSAKEPHRQAGMVTSGSLGGVMVITPAPNARQVGSIPALGKIFPIFITPTTIACQKQMYILPEIVSEVDIYYRYR